MSVLSPRANSKQLAHLCRSLGTSLQSGIELRRALQMCSKRSIGKQKSVLMDLTDQVSSGYDLSSAIDLHAEYFPRLFSDVAQIGEHAGALPEALLALSEHYENNIRLKKEFLSQITMPLVQLAVAVLVIAGLIFLLGVIGSSTGMTVDILGWGLIGPRGAMTWLGFWAMGITTIFVIWQLTTRSLAGKRIFHRFLMSVPVVGRCLQDFAIARFSWAFYLTQNAGMPIDDSLDASLRATSNGAFAAAANRMIRDINQGETLTETFENSGLFPIEFIQTVYVAENSGTVPEALHRLSPQFEENARRSLRTLAAVAGWAVWITVAGFIVFFIFTVIFWYIAQINGALDMINEI